MPNEQLYREIQSLERKIQLILNENQRLKHDIVQVKDENQDLKTKIDQQTTNLSSFQNQMKISKLVNNMVVEGSGSEELKQKLDGYIKEIDKCIAHLAE